MTDLNAVRNMRLGQGRSTRASIVSLGFIETRAVVGPVFTGLAVDFDTSTARLDRGQGRSAVLAMTAAIKASSTAVTALAKCLITLSSPAALGSGAVGVA